jgi:hypothetical protein
MPETAAALRHDFAEARAIEVTDDFAETGPHLGS